MANINFSRKEIEKEFPLNDKNLERIMMLGIPVESINSENLEIQILPNRPDLISLQGFVRAFKAFTGKATGLKKYKINPPEKDFKVKIDQSVKQIRPFTACAIVKNLSFNNEKIKELIELQEKIHTTLGRNRKKIAIGIYPLEKIKLPIKYEARKPEDIKFIPLEMTQELNGRQILQRHPTGRDYAHLLEEYDKFPVFVDSNKKILSMPPIINSNETGRITTSTKDIFVECSGSDFLILNKTLNIIITTLADMGGKIYSMELDYEKKEITPNLSPEKIKISLENINKTLGLQLKDKDLQEILPKMEYDYQKGIVTIPPWRTDILHEIDIIEDIAIGYGYEKLIPEIPNVATVAQESSESKVKSKISEILSGLGLLEISSYHLIKIEEAKSAEIKNKIELENAKTDYKILRPNLIIPALRIISENKDNEYPQKIFEIGTVFEKRDGLIKEREALLISLTPGNFTELKQIFDCLIRMLGTEYQIKEDTIKGFIEGRTGKIIIDNKEIGFMGETHPETLKSWNIKMPVSILEITIDDLIKKLN